MVREVQLRLLGNRPVTDTEASLASQISELEGRVARLHRLGAQYAHIRLSRHVDGLCEAAVVQGCGGRRVATEV
ncbi:MAG: hypothetical protein V2A79_16455 [Planctomycetota bacterium]